MTKADDSSSKTLPPLAGPLAIAVAVDQPIGRALVRRGPDQSPSSTFTRVLCDLAQRVLDAGLPHEPWDIKKPPACAGGSCSYDRIQLTG
jgi:hypothetical protein